MTFDEALGAMDACKLIIDRALPRFTDGTKAKANLEHCAFMAVRARQFDPDKVNKAMRWLGYMQGAIVAHGVATLEDMKAINMIAAGKRVTVTADD